MYYEVVQPLSQSEAILLQNGASILTKKGSFVLLQSGVANVLQIAEIITKYGSPKVCNLE